MKPKFVVSKNIKNFGEMYPGIYGAFSDISYPFWD